MIDEAENFVPSGAGTACKASAQSLAAQARKYGLGMTFATQTPRSIDNKIVSNRATHVYGPMGSSATIDAIHDMMAAKGVLRMISAGSPGASSIFDRWLDPPIQSAKAAMPQLAPSEPANG